MDAKIQNEIEQAIEHSRQQICDVLKINYPKKTKKQRDLIDYLATLVVQHDIGEAQKLNRAQATKA